MPIGESNMLETLGQRMEIYMGGNGQWCDVVDGRCPPRVKSGLRMSGNSLDVSGNPGFFA